ncbi:hypothetical protein HY636_04275 [Candidatus Woesearchaeota archaeon]|nr:hypothetical protein [Candidatus Woesearchaeota archaeon]
MPQHDQKSLQGLEDEDRKIAKCPECGSKDICFENEERFCKKCGYVFE